MNVLILLPYRDFSKSVKVLDDDRLRRQRSDVMTLLRAMSDPTHRNYNHPCCRMWREHGYWVIQYGFAASAEWMSRGYNDNTLADLAAWSADFPPTPEPAWLVDWDLYRSHQSYLVRTNPDEYRQYFPDITDGVEMIWCGRENAKIAAQKNAQRARKLAIQLAAQVEEAERALGETEPDSEESSHEQDVRSGAEDDPRGASAPAG